MRENSIKYTYTCIQCGYCCNAGLEIYIREEDVSNWIRAEKAEYFKHIQIDPKSISSEGLSGYHIEEKNALKDILNKYGEEKFEEKKKELADFILKNHEYVGKDVLPLPIYTFIEDLGRMPILIPHDIRIVLKGQKLGIVYILKYDLQKKCPFLKENLCSIHDIKPIDCRMFPYKDDGSLKQDKNLLKICNGYKIIKK